MQLLELDTYFLSSTGVRVLLLSLLKYPVHPSPVDLVLLGKYVFWNMLMQVLVANRLNESLVLLLLGFLLGSLFQLSLLDLER